MPAFESGASRSVSELTQSNAILRAPQTRLIGREDELAAIERVLGEPDLRLLTLTGPPGIGKTRLALALAIRARDRFSGRVWFVPLASVSEPALVLPAIAGAIGPSIQGTTRLLDELERRFGGNPALLVLDNFEQVLPAAADILELLSHCPQLTILVTSRAVLGLRCEREWSVAPLEVPPVDRGQSLAQMASLPSVALLIDRARAADQHFTLSDLNAGALGAICIRLEGIPLAIELAAPWLKVYSPSSLLNRLQQGFSALRGTVSDLEPRQRTLHDAVAWSDELLSMPERQWFHRLSVFAGSWTLEAALAVCRSEDDPEPVEEMLLGLVSKSLVMRQQTGDEPPRFRMLAMIRAYAQAQLDFQQAGERFRARHARYYAALGAEAREHLYREEQARWLEQLGYEHANLRAALRWLIDGGQREDALRLAADLENFWIVRDHLFEGQRWLEEALAMPGDRDSSAMVAARGALAAVLLRKGEYQPARRLLDQNLDIANEARDRVLAAETVHTLGISYWHAGELARARLLFEHALQLAQLAGDERVTARVLNHLGGMERLAGDDVAAVERYEASLAIWRRLADQERIAMVQHNMAPALFRLGERTRAGAIFAESLERSFSLRNAHGVALCLMGIAGAAARPGARVVQAARLLASAEALRQAIGARWDPDDRAERERSLAAVHRSIDTAAFEIAREQGAALSLDAAYEIGLCLARELAAEHLPSSRSSGQLTRREWEIAARVALGETNREIADRLSIAEKTVEMHVGHSLTKLGFRSRTQLAAWVTEQTMLGDGRVQTNLHATNTGMR